MRAFTRQQSGFVLTITLFMLVIFLLFIGASVMNNTNNLRIVGNLQERSNVESAAQIAIEAFLSSYSNFSAPAAQVFNVDINNDSTNDYAVAVSFPACTQLSKVTEGYSVDAPKPYDTYWELTADVTDNVTGASTTIVQGVRIRQPANATCPE